MENHNNPIKLNRYMPRVAQQHPAAYRGRYADEMKRYIGKLLDFDRGDLNEDGCTQGYVLDYSDDWTLIQFVERDIFINGYLVIRNDTIKCYRLFDDHKGMVHRALRKMKQFPASPGKIDLTDANTIVQSANALFPLIVIHRELRWKDECHIGGIADVTPKTIIISSIDPGAAHDGPYRIRSADITKIGFNGHYEVALWTVASQKTRKCITKHSSVRV